MSVLKEAQIFDDNVFKIRLKPLKIHEKSSMHEKGFITDGHLDKGLKSRKFQLIITVL
jgi:hypothetical protein